MGESMPILDGEEDGAAEFGMQKATQSIGYFLQPKKNLLES